MSTVLDSFVAVLPTLKNLNSLDGFDCGIAIANKDRYIEYLPSQNLDLGIKANDPVKKGTSIYQALQSREKVAYISDKRVFGKSYYGIAIPLFDDEQNVIGSVEASFSVEGREQLMLIVKEISEGMENVLSIGQEISNTAKELVNMSDGLNSAASQSVNQVKEMDKILDFIKKVANQTRMLGLNASIEAVRAGEQGRGFGVVANEIGKLADNSAKSTEQIFNVLRNVRQSMEEIAAIISQLNGISQNQVHLNDEIAQITQRVDALVEELTERTQRI